MIRLAKQCDLKEIEEIYKEARKRMKQKGNPDQWGKNYPPKELLLQDMEEEKLYVLEKEGILYGVFYFFIGDDPTYLEIEGEWKDDRPYGTIHRIAGKKGYRGVLKESVVFCEKRISHIRIDTHEDNHKMKAALPELGFQYCGIIYVEDGSPRLAYEK